MDVIFANEKFVLKLTETYTERSNQNTVQYEKGLVHWNVSFAKVVDKNSDCVVILHKIDFRLHFPSTEPVCYYKSSFSFNFLNTNQ